MEKDKKGVEKGKDKAKAKAKVAPSINKIRVTLTGRNHKHLEKGKIFNIILCIIKLYIYLSFI